VPSQLQAHHSGDRSRTYLRSAGTGPRRVRCPTGDRTQAPDALRIRERRWR
jgi:hypothetical protein